MNILIKLVKCVYFLLGLQVLFFGIQFAKADPLLNAIAAGDYKTVQKLIKEGADLNLKFVNKQDKIYDGFTYLHFAAVTEHPGVSLALIIGKADVNAINNDGKTPLYIASSLGRTKIVETLIRAKANVDLRDRAGYFPLERAAFQGHSDVINLLIHEGKANADQRTTGGITALYRATVQDKLSAVKALIFEGNADVSLSSKQGNTPLHLAVRSGKLALVKVLLQGKNANVNQLNKKGYSPLHLSIIHQERTILQELLKKKHNADVSLPGLEGKTSLHFATEQGDQEALEILVQSGGADLNRLDDLGYTPAADAALSGYLDVVRYLVRDQKVSTEVGSPLRRPLFFAAYQGDLEMVRFLWGESKRAFVPTDLGVFSLSTGEAQFVPSERVKSFLAALYGASAEGHLEVVQVLLDPEKVDVRLDTGNEERPSSLHAAVVAGHQEIAMKLIQAGARIDAAWEFDGSTPLHLASEFGTKEGVALLLSEGKKQGLDFINKNDFNGFTALELALNRGNIEIVKTLMKGGADYDRETKTRIESLQKELDKTLSSEVLEEKILTPKEGLKNQKIKPVMTSSLEESQEESKLVKFDLESEGKSLRKIPVHIKPSQERRNLSRIEGFYEKNKSDPFVHKKRAGLLERIFANKRHQSVRFPEIISLVNYLGGSYRVAGSHFTFLIPREDSQQRITFTVPRKSATEILLPCYRKKILMELIKLQKIRDIFSLKESESS